MKLDLSDGQSTISLEVGQLVGVTSTIGVTSTAPTERAKGKSVIRFTFTGDYVLKKEVPYDQLAAWHFEGTALTLQGEDIGTVAGCTLRECDLQITLSGNDPSRFYLSIYTPFSAQEVRHWFFE